jgi:phenylpropionate dioxygenase-like ring-hydroxylating dioxygenase large terminal subunit
MDDFRAGRGHNTGSLAEGWVDATRGLVSRDAFVSDEVFRIETDRIFARTWIFLAHESEVPSAGDYVVRRLGSAPVIVVRDAGGAIYVLLNSCRHRGTRLCRAEAGNARNFVCPYHGWSYATDGRLITTTFDQHFPPGTDFAALGLVRAPRIENYRGLVFASWDPEVEPFETYLGDIRFYIDAFFARTPKGMEVLAPPHRWRTRANWKMGSLNFIGDSQHVLTTHVGPVTLDRVRAVKEGFFVAGGNSFQVVTDNGHGCTLTYLAPGMREENYRTHAEELQPIYKEMLSADQVAMLHHLRVCVGTVFPNFSFIETQAGLGEKSIIIRLWQPVSATEMEIMSWVLAEKEASAEYKDHVLKCGFHNFGAAGVFEQDDLELWASSTEASSNPIARQFPYGFQTSIPYLAKPLASHKWPGRAYEPVHTEVAQFEFMRHWNRRMMDGQ